MNPIQELIAVIVGLTIISTVGIILWDWIFHSPKRAKEKKPERAREKLKQLSPEQAQVKENERKFNDLIRLIGDAEILRHHTPGQSDLVEAEYILRRAALAANSGNSKPVAAMLDRAIDHAQKAIAAFKKTAGIDDPPVDNTTLSLDPEPTAAAKLPDELDSLPGLDDHDRSIDN